MMPPRPDEPGWPTPDLLAAYADGELDGRTCARLEAWLADHPEAAAEVEAQQRIVQIWHEVAIPEPDPTAWDATLQRIEAGVLATRARRRRIPWIVAPVAAAILVAAASLLVPLVNALREAAETSPIPSGTQATEGPLPVASADDIIITSLDDEDHAALVVGDPPGREPLALAAPGDVLVHRVHSDVAGMNPEYPQDGSGVPMIIMMPRPPVPDVPAP